MPLPRFLPYLVAAALLALAGRAPAQTPPDAAEHAGNPVLPVEAADPSIALFGDRYYLYATGAGAAAEAFAVWSSPDLAAWRDEGTILDLADLAWKEPAQQNETWHGGAWAPDAIERNGTYYFYFSAGSNIGVATSDTPAGPFADALGEPLLPYRDDLSTIDPMPFIDDDGRAYLYWGAVPASWLESEVDTIHTTMWVRELNPDMVSFAGPARPTVGTPPEGPHIEGSYVFKREGTYYLTWSEGNWNAADDANAYRVHYATAPSPLGPWTAAGHDPILSLDRDLGVIGPGHNSFFRRPGTDDHYIAYHAHSGEVDPEKGRPLRHVYVDRLTFTEDGRIEPVRPTREGVRPLPIHASVRAAEPGPYRTSALIALEARTEWPADEVARVTFYANGEEIGVAQRPPYRLSWKGAAPGFYRVTAQVAHRSGEAAWAAPINVDVR